MLVMIYTLFSFPLFGLILAQYDFLPINRKHSYFLIRGLSTSFLACWFSYIPQFFLNPIFPTPFHWGGLWFYYLSTYFGFTFWIPFITLLIRVSRDKKAQQEERNTFLFSGIGTLFICLLIQNAILLENWSTSLEVFLIPLWYQIIFICLILQNREKPKFMLPVMLALSLIISALFLLNLYVGGLLVVLSLLFLVIIIWLLLSIVERTNS